MRTALLTDFVLMALLGTAGVLTVLFVAQRQADVSILIVFAAVLFVRSVIQRRQLRIAPRKGSSRAQRSYRRNALQLAAEDQAPWDEGTDIVGPDLSPTIPVDSLTEYQVEIRPGIWGYDDALPPEVVARFLASRKVPAPPEPQVASELALECTPEGLA